jgi:hypothetical protein
VHCRLQLRLIAVPGDGTGHASTGAYPEAVKGLFQCTMWTGLTKAGEYRSQYRSNTETGIERFGVTPFTSTSITSVGRFTTSPSNNPKSKLLLVHVCLVFSSQGTNKLHQDWQKRLTFFFSHHSVVGMEESSSANSSLHLTLYGTIYGAVSSFVREKFAKELTWQNVTVVSKAGKAILL